MSTKDLPPSSSADALTSTATNPNPGPDGDNYPWVRPTREAKGICDIPCCRKTPKDCQDGVLLFEFPRDLNRCAEWMKNICDVPTVRMATLEECRATLEGAKICALHFDPAEIQESEDESSATREKKYRLANEAIPTRNLPCLPINLEDIEYEDLDIQN